MQKLKFIITAGPTREYLDPVRFLTNASSGKIGYACAAAAKRRGHNVTLISGPVKLKAPTGIKKIDVMTGAAMDQAVRRYYETCDCVIMTAAVGDYKPKRTARYKIKKQQDALQLELVRTKDILAGLGRRKKNQILIGFAVQDRAARSHARRKLLDKNLDAVVVNSPSAFGADKTDVEILIRDRDWQSFPDITKTRLATHLIRLGENLLREQRGLKAKIL
jgi:phosphopantothenoylcysteine decarboxylase/phosphopantothenate--cysteine ligase